MTTKDQEREALKKIVKIMESLGANSYVATAFAGCVEIAEENINNDFGCSMKQHVEIMEEKLREETRLRDDAKKAVRKLREMLENANQKLDEKNDQIADLHRIIDGIEEEKAKLTDQLIVVSGYRAKAEQKVMELKAKLYDLMTDGK